MSELQPPPTRKIGKADVARAEILSAAAGLMRRVGYAEMSLRDLAAEVNMKAGSLYYHFQSKDDLVTEVMRIGVEVVEAAVREALARHPDLPPTDRIMIAVRVHLDTMLKKSDFVSSHIRCYPFVPTPIRNRLREVRRSYDRIWIDLLGEYLGPDAAYDDVRYLRHLLIGALNGALEWFNPNRDSAMAFAGHIEALLRNAR
ncbi:TetR/AcrR family transcriptional regulator [Xinfangfangia pollutisoli]|uniref:TetR/AcrR family transcriptional regulator n=1 Tax=Xinfangfangia pollutisoli TaxID=2865960 RepID=UPI001CD4B7D1|nr:TetR/AcrR family transcriptional regulator [Xinfangfangia pollutisoli]